LIATFPINSLASQDSKGKLKQTTYVSSTDEDKSFCVKTRTTKAQGISNATWTKKCGSNFGTKPLLDKYAEYFNDDPDATVQCSGTIETYEKAKINNITCVYSFAYGKKGFASRATVNSITTKTVNLKLVAPRQDAKEIYKAIERQNKNAYYDFSSAEKTIATISLDLYLVAWASVILVLTYSALLFTIAGHKQSNVDKAKLYAHKAIVVLVVLLSLAIIKKLVLEDVVKFFALIYL
jgi:hypothetical protein